MKFQLSFSRKNVSINHSTCTIIKGSRSPRRKHLSGPLRPNQKQLKSGSCSKVRSFMPLCILGDSSPPLHMSAARWQHSLSEEGLSQRTRFRQPVPALGTSVQAWPAGREAGGEEQGGGPLPRSWEMGVQITEGGPLGPLNQRHTAATWPS